MIAWYLDCKNQVKYTQKTLDRLFEEKLVKIDNTTKHETLYFMVYFFVCSLYERYRANLDKIFTYLSYDEIYDISLFFIRKNNLKTGVFKFLRTSVNNDSKINKLDTYSFAEIIEKCNRLDNRYTSHALSTIAPSLVQSNRLQDSAKVLDEAIKLVEEEVEDTNFKVAEGVEDLLLALQYCSITKSNRLNEAIETIHRGTF